MSNGVTMREFQGATLATAATGLLADPARASAQSEATLAGDGVLRLPAQDIPAPKSLSPQAQAFLVAAAKRIAARAAASAAPADAQDGATAALAFLRPAAARFAGTFETVELPHGASLYRATPEGRTGRHAQVAYFDIHGGGFVAGGGEMCQLLAKIRAADYGMEIFAIDYRLAPRHPFPAALDDCMAAYHEILKRVAATDLAVGGASAGGNLAAALMLRARDEALAMPVALVLQTPALDLTRSGDTYTTNRYLDVNLHGGEGGGPSAYAGGADLPNPHLSPLFGNFSKGWPPTILASGTRDLLLSDTVRMHRKLCEAGVEAELYVTEAGPHGGFMGSAPEDHFIIGVSRSFIYRQLSIAAQIQD
jgi:acetyl esterase/lipase